MSKNNKQSTTHVIYTPHNLFIKRSQYTQIDRIIRFSLKQPFPWKRTNFFYENHSLKVFFQLKNAWTVWFFFILFIDMFVLNLNLNVELIWWTRWPSTIQSSRIYKFAHSHIYILEPFLLQYSVIYIGAVSNIPVAIQLYIFMYTFIYIFKLERVWCVADHITSHHIICRLIDR